MNLERAAQVVNRLGGHIVQGHIDGTAPVLVHPSDGSAWRVIRLPSLGARPARGPKGSIAIDGTLAHRQRRGRARPWFEVSLIPETLTATTHGALPTPGDRVNIETDILARHVAAVLAFPEKRGGSAYDHRRHPHRASGAARRPTRDRGRRREPRNEGDMIIAARRATPGIRRLDGPAHLGFHLRADHKRNRRPARAAAHGAENQDPRGTAYTVSVDVGDRLTTGISASDARTLRVLADPLDPVGPHPTGHMIPLRAVDGGV